MVMRKEPSLRPAERDYVVETNRLRGGRSIRALVRRINREAGRVVAELVRHRTTIVVRGVSLTDLAALLRLMLEPRIGSALIVRASGFTARAWVLSMRGNRLMTRIA